MNVVTNIVITLTLAAIGLSGTAQARPQDDRDGMRRDNTRIEQRAERRASRERIGKREGRRFQKRDHVESDYAYDGYGRVDRRRDRQWSRLLQGRRSGELSRGEFRRLKKQQRRIGRMERRFSSDGYLSGRERYRLERAQSRASRHIARAKHNDIYKGYGRWYGHPYKRDRGYDNKLWDY